ncbi:MAG: HEAT repeat domain-containing protein [Deltaproteobacteria bacterium]|nr:HEAT repeat domain-containing protein [Deltaproteobacteria bacterium]MBF0525630.1 HEAT repeat domain-containing protein [Deltaproteobacteria bacterium]
MYVQDRGKRIKFEIFQLLQAPDAALGLDAIARFPARKVINPLFLALCSGDEQVKWRAVTAMGRVVGQLADDDMEAARMVMRRFMWNLNDESGGIGWGCAEAMGEIMAGQAGLASEYAHMLLSYIQPDGNYLEHPMLRRGALWGLGRMAQTRPQLLNQWEAARHLMPYLEDGDAQARGLAVWSLGLLGAGPVRSGIEALLSDEAEMQLYRDGRLIFCRIKDLAAEARPRV